VTADDGDDDDGNVLAVKLLKLRYVPIGTSLVDKSINFLDVSHRIPHPSVHAYTVSVSVDNVKGMGGRKHRVRGMYGVRCQGLMYR
jgi:hypothetical protein